MKKYKYSIDIDLADFSDWDFLGLNKNNYPFSDNLYDATSQWDSPVYCASDYYLSEYWPDLKDYLISQKISKKEIKQNKSELKDDLLRALSDSWLANIDKGIYELYQDRIKHPNFEYSAFEYIDNKGNKTEALHDAVLVRYCFSERLWRSQAIETDYSDKTYQGYSGNWYTSLFEARDYAHIDLFDYAMDNLDKITTGNYSDIHMIQDHADYDCWLDYFKDYSEALCTIEQNRKAKQIRLKALIKNHVPLDTRLELIGGA